MKKSRMKRNGFSLLLIFAGVLIIIITFAWEAYHYPWLTVFGGNQDDSALPEPPPIVWDGSDHEASAPDPDASQAPSSAAILPGNELQMDTQPAGYVDLGTIKIPKLGLSQHVLEGTQKQLHYGVGHVTGTARMGASDNCALAGHNTTSFRYLNKLSVGDRVILKANGDVFTYSVFRSFTVLPTNVSVLNRLPNENATLTLITCTPYLTATQRLIVQARLIDVNGSAFSSTPQPGYSTDPGLVPSASSASAPLSVEESSGQPENKSISDGLRGTT